MSKLVGYKEGNMLQDIRKTKDVKETAKKNKYQNKYMALRHDKRHKGKLEKHVGEGQTYARTLKELGRI